MKKLGTLTILLAALFMIAATPPGHDGYQVGDKAEDFKLMNVDGSWVSLSDYKDAKGYVVIFSCNSCPYVVANEDRMIALHEKYAPMGYPVIAINPNDPELKPEDSFENMKIRAEEKDFPFVYLFDKEQEVFPKFGATRTPHVYLLDENLIVQYIGAIDDNPREASGVEVKYVENAIASLEEGKTPEVTNTKAIGCGIKSKLDKSKASKDKKTKTKT